KPLSRLREWGWGEGAPGRGAAGSCEKSRALTRRCAPPSPAGGRGAAGRFSRGGGGVAPTYGKFEGHSGFCECRGRSPDLRAKKKRAKARFFGLHCHVATAYSAVAPSPSSTAFIDRRMRPCLSTS